MQAQAGPVLILKLPVGKHGPQPLEPWVTQHLPCACHVPSCCTPGIAMTVTSLNSLLRGSGRAECQTGLCLAA